MGVHERGRDMVYYPFYCPAAGGRKDMLGEGFIVCASLFSCTLEYWEKAKSFCQPA